MSCCEPKLGSRVTSSAFFLAFPPTSGNSPFVSRVLEPRQKRHFFCFLAGPRVIVFVQRRPPLKEEARDLQTTVDMKWGSMLRSDDASGGLSEEVIFRVYGLALI